MRQQTDDGQKRAIKRRFKRQDIVEGQQSGKKQKGGANNR